MLIRVSSVFIRGYYLPFSLCLSSWMTHGSPQVTAILTSGS